MTQAQLLKEFSTLPLPMQQEVEHYIAFLKQKISVDTHKKNNKVGYEKASTLRLETIETDSKTFLFNKPVLFRINKEGKYFILENEQLDIFASGKTQDEARVELYNQFEHSYQWFNELKDDELSDELLKVKVYYNLIVNKAIDK